MRLLLLVACVAACDADLQRMVDQPHFTSYEACSICPEGTIMMMPPPGTVGRDGEEASLGAGRSGPDGFVQTIPIELDTAVLARGRNRFDIYCAACHGRLGNGISQVAENMTLRKPPNLIGPPYTTYPPGRVFTAISEGFGLMRSYASELPVRDRWAIVAYLQALQLSQNVVLRELPQPIQQEAQKWLK
ncbi:MAG: cytochrome c [Kofleriaceae bacterium]|nr:cytochrome c [Kofleriaceae bacterium]